MSKVDINTVDDEDALYKMLNGTDDFEERKKLRTRMREIREAKAAKFEQARLGRDDATTMRIRQAEEAKQRKLKDFEDQAKGGRQDDGKAENERRQRFAAAETEKQRKIQEYNAMGKVMAKTYHTGSEILMKAEDEQQKRVHDLSAMKEEGVSSSTKTEQRTDGGTTTTATTVTTQRTKDGSSTTTKQTKQVTQTSGVGGTSYKMPAAVAAKTGPRGARAAFQQMDKTTGPPAGAGRNFGGGATTATTGGGRVAVQRSASTIKQMLLDWCKSMTKEYESKIQITNFSSCWNNGIAFCALIHHFYPDAFNFEELDPKNRRYNFNLAFDTAEQKADIAPLLDVEDMVRMKNPDWKCVFTYVQSFYRRFRMQEQKA